MHWIYAHLIGDYLLQNDWMSQNKKLASWPCFVHTITYLIPFIFTPLAWWQLVLIFLQHFFQDRFQFAYWFLRLKGSPDFAMPPTAPWSLIVIDNIFHILFVAFIAWLPQVFL